MTQIDTLTATPPKIQFDHNHVVISDIFNIIFKYHIVEGGKILIASGLLSKHKNDLFLKA